MRISYAILIVTALIGADAAVIARGKGDKSDDAADIVGAALGLAGGITAAAGAEGVGAALTAAGDAVDGQDGKKNVKGA